MQLSRLSVISCIVFALSGCGEIIMAPPCSDTSAASESCDDDSKICTGDDCPDAGGIDEAGDAGIGCLLPDVSSLLVPTSCDTSAPSLADSCEQIYDGSEHASPPSITRLIRTCDSNGTSDFCTYSSECPGGCIGDLWFRFDFGSSMQVNHMRFLAAHWNERPRNWELWASDDPALEPSTGATLVTSGVGEMNPWSCVSGEACTDEVPDACCPDGRDQPQDTRNVGGTWPKYDQQELSWQSGRYWYFLIKDTYARNQLDVFEVQLFGAACGE